MIKTVVPNVTTTIAATSSTKITIDGKDADATDGAATYTIPCPSTRSEDETSFSFLEIKEEEKEALKSKAPTIITNITATLTPASLPPTPTPTPTPCCLPPFRLFSSPSSSSSYQHTRLSPINVQAYLQQFGTRAMSYVHLHHSHYHFEGPNNLGLVSYCWVLSYLGRAALVMIDPLCCPQDLHALLLAFHNTVPGMKQYVAVSERIAQTLREQPFGYDATVFGRDFYADFDVWKPPKGRRRYLSEGRRHGLVVKEQKWHEVEHLAPRIQEISDLWLKSKKGGARELQLMTWPFYMGDEWEVRKFYVYDYSHIKNASSSSTAHKQQEGQDQEGRSGKKNIAEEDAVSADERKIATDNEASVSAPLLVAYMFFTPCFRDGHIVGYQANILRRDVTIQRPSYILDHALLHCQEIFRKEGLEFLGLSLAPIYGLVKMMGDSSLLRTAFQVWYHFPVPLYGFKGLGRHKDHFHVNRVENVYACTRGVRSALSIQQLILTVTNTLAGAAKVLHGIES